MLRGSGDIAAFIASCWGTRLQDPERPYESASYFENLKQRDFESRPFEVTSGPDCRLHIVGDPATRLVKRKSCGGMSKKPGYEEALAIVRANIHMPVRDILAAVQAAGFDYKLTWVTKRTAELKFAAVNG